MDIQYGLRSPSAVTSIVDYVDESEIVLSIMT